MTCLSRGYGGVMSLAQIDCDYARRACHGFDEIQVVAISPPRE